MAGKITQGVGTNGQFDTCWNSSDLYIGNYTSIGRELRVYLGGNHNPKFISQFAFYNLYSFDIDRSWDTKGDVVIGSDVWIGEYVTIMSGVHIGDGATIGAKSVVAKDIPPFAIAVGNPCEVKKYRFPQEIIDRLMVIAWWNWGEEKIKHYCRILTSNLTLDNLKILEEVV
jgi:acetyltransferase-like isoleucine patch superfamily enzyme